MVNKIDMPAANPEEVTKQIEDVFGLGGEGDAALRVSAKTGQGVPELLDAVVHRIAPPETDREARPFKALIFDAHHDQFRGVVCLCRVIDGKISRGDKIASCGTKTELEVLRVIAERARNPRALRRRRRSASARSKRRGRSLRSRRLSRSVRPR